MKKQFTLILLLLSKVFFSTAQTSLQGQVTDSESGEELIGANVVIKKNDVFIAGTSTDFNANYYINLEPDTFSVHVTMLGYPKHIINDVILIKDESNKLNFLLESSSSQDSIVVNKFKSRKILAVATSTDCFVYSRIIDPLPNRVITLITAESLKCKFIVVDHENTMRWVWANNYYLDGVRVDKNVSNISSFDIEQIQVFNGGVPAAYDDSCSSVFSLLSN